jgi:hypothetical protein
VSDFEVVTPRPVRPLIDALAGKRAGYRLVYEQLGRDPCASHLGAYRLSGPLEPIVCGVHLRRGFRLAFTIQPPETRDGPTRVVILYVGPREPRHRQGDVWTVLHDLFGVDNPPAGHHQAPCCDGGLPQISQDELDAFLDELRRLTTGRRSPRRGAAPHHMRDVARATLARGQEIRAAQSRTVSQTV